MPFGNKDTIIARYHDEYYLNDVDPAKFDEVADEVSDLIYQITSVQAPDDPAVAVGTLRGIWTDIVLFKIIPYQKDLSDEEKSRRTTLYRDAMNLLWEIQNGKISLKDSDGNSISADAVITIESSRTNRGAP